MCVEHCLLVENFTALTPISHAQKAMDKGCGFFCWINEDSDQLCSIPSQNFFKHRGVWHQRPGSRVRRYRDCINNVPMCCMIMCLLFQFNSHGVLAEFLKVSKHRSNSLLSIFGDKSGGGKSGVKFRVRVAAHSLTHLQVYVCCLLTQWLYFPRVESPRQKCLKKVCAH